MRNTTDTNTFSPAFVYQSCGMMEWCLLKFLRENNFASIQNFKQIKKVIFWCEGSQKIPYLYIHIGEDVLAKWKKGKQEKGVINLEKNRNWGFPRWSKEKWKQMNKYSIFCLRFRHPSRVRGLVTEFHLSVCLTTLVRSMGNNHDMLFLF